MRAKLNSVVVVEWDDALPEKAVVIRGTTEKLEYEVFFPERKRGRTGWVGTEQIIFIKGQIKV